MCGRSGSCSRQSSPTKPAHPGVLGRPDLMAALAYPLWVPGVGLIGFLLLLFPDGRLPSPRWRPVAWLLGGTIALLTLTGFFLPGVVQETEYVNPLGIEALESFDQGAPGFALVVILVSASWLRPSRSWSAIEARSGVERLQLKWMMAAGLVSALAYGLLFFWDEFDIQLVWAVDPDRHRAVHASPSSVRHRPTDQPHGRLRGGRRGGGTRVRGGRFRLPGSPRRRGPIRCRRIDPRRGSRWSTRSGGGSRIGSIADSIGHISTPNGSPTGSPEALADETDATRIVTVGSEWSPRQCSQLRSECGSDDAESCHRPEAYSQDMNRLFAHAHHHHHPSWVG